MNSIRKHKKPSIINQILVVNQSAGRLRFIIFLLFFFIIWSFVAQTVKPPSAYLDFFTIFFPEPTNLTSSLFQEILLSYFYPKAILFSLLPIIIFLLMRRLIARFLFSLFPGINYEEILKYLNNCAFSFSSGRNGQLIPGRGCGQQTKRSLSTLGGPARINIRSFSTMIVSSFKTDSYVYHSNNLEQNYDHFLSHGEVIWSNTIRNDEKFEYKHIDININENQSIQFDKIVLKILFTQPDNHIQAPGPQETTQSDAMIFFNLEDDRRETIIHYFRDEINTFLKSTAFTEVWQSNSLTIENNKTEPPRVPTPQKSHKQQGINIPSKFLFYKRTSRKHKRSLYPYLQKMKADHLISEEKQTLIGKIEQRLLQYLNEQFKSFFHTTNILISILEMYGIKINE